jgi:voltage-gated potassium channel
MTGVETLRHKAFRGLEIGLAGRGPMRFVHAFVVLLIIANVTAVVLESHQPFAEAHGRAFWLFELVSVAIFSLEYGIRLWCIVEAPRYRGMSPARARIRYALSPLALIDLAAILPFYLAFLVPFDLRFLRVLRLLRLLKLSHYFPGLDVFLHVLRVQLPALLAASMVMVVLILFSACLMFILERPAQQDAFSSIGTSIWWAVVTLTTVGYGDMTPITPLGKLLGAGIMLLGVGTVALPAAMLAGRFSEEIQSRRSQLETLVAEYIDDGLLDSSERDEIDRLGRELGIPSETIDGIVRRQRPRGGDQVTCPHCGQQFPHSPHRP